jgi:8-oxo-dGTP diphosphatase
VVILSLMLKNFLSSLWQYLPAPARRWSVRATNSKFTVTAAGIILNAEGKVLLLKHRFRVGSGWGIPGGFLEAGEQAGDALRRELREEIDLELEDSRLFAVRTFKRQNQIEVVFIAQAFGSSDPKSIEVERAVWFSSDALPVELASDQKKLIESALRDGAKGAG